MEKLGLAKEYIELIQDIPNSMEEYQFYLGLKERKIYFNQEVDMNIINKVVYWIMRWNEEDKDVPIADRKIIEFYVSSNGGCVVSGLSVLDAMKASKTPVSTIGIGTCSSMGALLLLGGTKGYRKCYPNTTILLHDGNLSLNHTGKKARQVMDFYDELEDKLKAIVLENTKIPEELYDEKSDEEWFMFGTKALEYGIVDELIV